MPLDPYYRDRFAGIADVTWERLLAGDADAIDRAIAYGETKVHYVAPESVGTTDDVVPGPHGDVPVRVYRHVDTPGDAGVLVWLHGGAFKWGGLDQVESHGVAAEIALRSRFAVVAVDYRLVPAFRYPVPLDDCVAVVERLATDHRVALGGASAGGNLASGAALRVRDQGSAEIAGLCLAYPAVHKVIPPLPAELAAMNAQLPPLARFTAAQREEIYRDYLGELYDDPPVYGTPVIADLRGLAPVAMAIAEFDDLRPSAESFAAELRAAGVEVHEWVETGTAHGYLDLMGEVAGASRTIEHFVAHLGVHLA